MEGLVVVRRRVGLRLGVTAAHDRRSQALFQHFARAGFEYSLVPHQRGALSLIVEISLDSIGLFLREQARF
jgi:hypothetical protein